MCLQWLFRRAPRIAPKAQTNPKQDPRDRDPPPQCAQVDRRHAVKRPREQQRPSNRRPPSRRDAEEEPLLPSRRRRGSRGGSSSTSSHSRKSRASRTRTSTRTLRGKGVKRDPPSHSKKSAGQREFKTRKRLPKHSLYEQLPDERKSASPTSPSSGQSSGAGAGTTAVGRDRGRTRTVNPRDERTPANSRRRRDPPARGQRSHARPPPPPPPVPALHQIPNTGIQIQPQPQPQVPQRQPPLEPQSLRRISRRQTQNPPPPPPPPAQQSHLVIPTITIAPPPNPVSEQQQQQSQQRRHRSSRTTERHSSRPHPRQHEELPQHHLHSYQQHPQPQYYRHLGVAAPNVPSFAIRAATNRELERARLEALDPMPVSTYDSMRDARSAAYRYSTSVTAPSIPSVAPVVRPTVHWEDSYPSGRYRQTGSVGAGGGGTRAYSSYSQSHALPRRYHEK